MKALIVEDDQKTAISLQKGLAEMAIISDVAYDGISGFVLAERNTYDLLLLDVSLPKMDGFELVTRLRLKGGIPPVIFITARDSVSDRVEGLKLGKGDYIELLAKVYSVI